MNKLTTYLFALICLFLTACEESDDVKIVNVTFNCILPEEIPDARLNKLSLEVRNINTGKTYTFEQDPKVNVSASLEVGLYKIAAKGKIIAKVENKDVTYNVNGLIQSLEVTNEGQSADLKLFADYGKPGFVLAEIFFAGTKTPQDAQYFADKYFVIYNNSDKTLYADSLAIAESAFLSVMKNNYSPDIMDKAMAVQALYMIPGDGKSHPVEPGESILICDNALNHKKANPNSFDLTKADFEWADESTNPNISDVNNPRVPDLTKIYCSTKTVWSPHNRGFASYALLKMGTSKEDFLANYKYDYKYDLVVDAGTFPMKGSHYKVPNSWIIDAVGLSVEALFQWLVVDPSLDRGWTHCGNIDFDESRYGKSVRRKVERRTPEGIAVLKDTNNSTEDFEADQIADPYHKF